MWFAEFDIELNDDGTVNPRFRTWPHEWRSLPFTSIEDFMRDAYKEYNLRVHVSYVYTALTATGVRGITAQEDESFYWISCYQDSILFDEWMTCVKMSDTCPDCGGDKVLSCGWCAGTGEGMADGARCTSCHGSGSDGPCPTCSANHSEPDYDKYDDERPEGQYTGEFIWSWGNQ